jgi:hypothetical protein
MNQDNYNRTHIHTGDWVCHAAGCGHGPITESYQEVGSGIVVESASSLCVSRSILGNSLVARLESVNELLDHRRHLTGIRAASSDCACW